MWGAIIAGVAAIAGAIINNQSNKKRQQEANRANLENQQSMWEQTNEYNDPTNQMLRLQKAGLNPNLIYGSGAPYNTAQNQNVPDFKSHDTQNPLESAPSTVADYYNIRQQEQRVSNETLVATTNAANTAADTLNKKVAGEGMAFDLSQRRRLADNAFNLQELNVAQAKQQLQRQQIENANLPEIYKEKLLEASTRRMLMGEQMSTEQLRREQMKLEIDLKKAGLDNAPWWSRFIYRILDDNPYKELSNYQGWNFQLKPSTQINYYKSKLG